MAGVTQVDHPLVRQHLSELRASSTLPADFRDSVRRLAVLLAYEATQDLPTTATTIQTPLAETEGHQLAGRVGLVPILRAGLGMVEPVLDLIPTAEVWHLGLYRDESTARPVRYYDKLPPERPVDTALVLDPMLATGGSAIAALQTLAEWGVDRLKVLAIIGSQEGVARVTAEFPGAQLYLCQVDPELNDRKFIVPGLGDAGDRMFNTMIG
ncbi:MAG: uracil phosphoribosyltransferase [Planctomycetales bacterium]|nr:uracil phosphoribosyltransferase [Planctomycetales bacterium]